VISEPLNSDATIVIVGASLAGVRAAQSLRRLQHRGRIVLIGDEPHRPYDRPPLSKEYLKGDRTLAGIEHSSVSSLGNVDLVLGHRAVGLNLGDREVELDDGRRVPFDGVIIATGVRAKDLRGFPVSNRVRSIRTLDDSTAVRNILVGKGSDCRVVVIGAGFVGAEVASTVRHLGAAATVIEAMPTPLDRVLGEEVGNLIADIHRSAGVSLRLSSTVAGIETVGDSVRIMTHDGTRLLADVAVVAVGSTPATEWLSGSGLEVADGLACDDHLFAAPRVVAAGDVARWMSRRANATMRVEHWTNAAESGAVAARNLLVGSSAATPYDPIPFFWSDQFGRRLQMLGSRSASADVVIVDGEIKESRHGRVVALYHSGARLTGVFGIDRPKIVRAFRPLLERSGTIDEALDVATELVRSPSPTHAAG
jgi:NADPH-dependent 2,4-dienoyl-CoA reductase/sulfur reductase-like enzyme